MISTLSWEAMHVSSTFDPVIEG
ncbi:MAG: hypothetical protein QOF72_2832, partial [Blastocatellia bacterium]|nr:hypothetical protein [Blastocatellia bacterium]